MISSRKQEWDDEYVTALRNRFLFTVVVIIVAGVAFGWFDDDNDGGIPDISKDDRRVEIHFHATGGTKDKPIRFDLDGGFSGGVDFREDDKRDGHRKTGVATKGTTTWAKMYLHVYSPVPSKMWCEVWQNGKDITYIKEIYPAKLIPYCAGQVV